MYMQIYFKLCNTLIWIKKERNICRKLGSEFCKILNHEKNPLNLQNNTLQIEYTKTLTITDFGLCAPVHHLLQKFYDEKDVWCPFMSPS